MVFCCCILVVCVVVALIECMMFNLRIVLWVGVALVECMMFNLRIVVRVVVALVECMMFNLRIVVCVVVALVECMMFNLRIGDEFCALFNWTELWKMNYGMVVWFQVIVEVPLTKEELRQEVVKEALKESCSEKMGKMKKMLELVEILKQNKTLSCALDHQATVIGTLEKAVSRLEEVLAEKEKQQEGDECNLSNENHDDDDCTMSIEPIAVDYSNVKFSNDEEKCFSEMEVYLDYVVYCDVHIVCDAVWIKNGDLLLQKIVHKILLT
ncbi:hypothetical protein VNO80_10427 [Phaseolus coccineus]|uniref:Uncharacterized protein n=1 Tax=Phaseolus coccineus TaxID=3886 RepID=A0AAN9RDU1_PHACN